MDDNVQRKNSEESRRLERAYNSEKAKFLARLRAAGRTLEEAEDIVHDVYAETMARLPLLPGIRNLPAWLSSLLRRRMIDAWRHDTVRAKAGEAKITEETLREIIAETGLNPLDRFVRESLMDALNDAIRMLPEPQRKVIEAQVFGGMTFREISEKTGESIDTLTARKRYAVQKLSHALRHWIEE